MSEIKIFVACHKESYLPESDILCAVQAGAALSDRRFDRMRHDDDGIHISEKNKAYCELTVQYWAWKNVEADYYGFCHYRRYFSFEKEYQVLENGKLPVRRWRPYSELEDIKNYSVSDDRIREVIEKYDVVTVLREPMNSTVYEQYGQFHYKKDLDRMLELLYERYPGYRSAAEAYMASKEHYFLNMYVMKKAVFCEYMEWVFPLLEEFEATTDFTDYSGQEYRATAYLAERLFGIYFTHIKRNKKMKCCELPYVIFQNTEPLQQIRPVFGHESVNLVMSADNRFAPYLSVLIYSVLECSKEENNYDMVILHRNITEENQKKISQMAQERENVCIRFCDLSDYVKGIPFKVHHHFSVETFYRYFILEAMQAYQKVLYLDSDMVVRRDVAELYRENIDGYMLAAAKDVDVIGSVKSDEKSRRYVKESLKIEKALEYFQAGVLLLNLQEMRKRTSCKELVEKTLEQKWNMVDQDVLNIICQGKVKFLNQKWNVLMNWTYGTQSRMNVIKHVPVSLWEEYQEARKEPFIIHYAGAWKPWNTPNCDYAEEFWRYARKTSFYEVILYENMSQMKECSSSDGAEGKRVIYLRPTNLKVSIDMKLVNRLMPAGSKRRVIVRQLCNKFL